MTDQELIVLAAKAAGFELVNKVNPWLEGSRAVWITYKGYEIVWNPFVDDGDAFRLAVKLGMAVSVCLGMPSGDFTAILGSGFDSEKHKTDPYAATRRAIVRAAAEIGESMP